MRTTSIIRRLGRGALLAIGLLAFSQAAWSQSPAPAWNATKYFKYNIEKVWVSGPVAGAWNVKVIFSVLNPTNGDVWNIRSSASLPFQSTGAGLTLDIGWDSATDFTNTGSANAALTPVTSTPTAVTQLGAGAANPIQVRNLQGNAAAGIPGTAIPCPDSTVCPGVTSLYNRYYVVRTVTPVKFTQTVTTGRVAIEGKPVCNGFVECPAGPPYAIVPVRSEVVDFAFRSSATPVSAIVPDPRRQVVDFDTKCAKCHDGVKLSGSGTPIPRLSLHGGNRNENVKLCVMCHNPNQTDVPYRLLTIDPRTSGPETSIDFKRMIHSIHAGGFRETPLVVIGFGASINDFSDVRFPGELRNCTSCHLDNGRKGTFELPLRSYVLGSTVTTGSTYAVPLNTLRTIDVDPNNDLKITPTAATCSGCHDKSEVRSHMIGTGGASFAALQRDIGTRYVEKCASCHGPGKDKDVRKAHEIGGSSLD